jgi:hypothetical protein
VSALHPGDRPADTHRCPADGCTVEVPFERLACLPHWRLVSRPTQRALSSAWRHGPVARHLELREQAVHEINAALADRDARARRSRAFTERAAEARRKARG